MTSSQKVFKITLLFRVSPRLTAHSVFVRFFHLVCWSSQLLFKFLAYWWGAEQQRNETVAECKQNAVQLNCILVEGKVLWNTQAILEKKKNESQGGVVAVEESLTIP